MLKSKKTNTLHASFKPTTAEQLIEIKQLHNEILDLCRQLNRPLSAAISILAFPFLVDLVFLNKSAMFYGAAAKLTSSLGLHTLLPNTNPSVYQEAIGPLAEALDKDLLVTSWKESGMQVTLKEHLSPFDALMEARVSNLHVVLKKWFEKTKFALVNSDVIDKASSLVGSLPSQPKYSEIYQAAYEMLELYKADLENTSHLLTDSVHFILSSAKILRAVLFFASITTGVLGEKFILDPILLRFWHGREWISRDPSLAFTQHQYDYADAQREIEKLKKAVGALRAKAAPYKNIARVAFAIATPVAVIKLITWSGVSAYSALTYLAITATATKDAIADFKAWRQEKNLQKDFSHFFRLLNLVYLGDWSGVKGNTIGNSYFYITTSKFEKLSADATAYTLEYCLIKHGIIPQYRRGNYLVISGNALLNEKNAAEISTHFKQTITRLNQIKALHQQLRILIKKLAISDNLLVFPQHDQNDLPIRCFQVFMPQPIIDLNRQLFLDGFTSPGNKVSFKAAGIIIEGYAPLEKELFAKLIAEVRVPAAAVSLSSISALSDEPIPRRQRPKKVKASELAEAMDGEQISQESADILPQKIYWRKQWYALDDRSCPLHPLLPFRSTHGRHFVTSELSSEDMPKGTSAEEFVRIERVFQQSQLGAKGQGCKYVKGMYLKSKQGELKEASLKYRFFGAHGFGDSRALAYAEQAKSEQGENLIVHVVSALSRHAH
ncbi:MAG: hypothetical protein K0S08_1574 [Gammaproteobacteria bacterium]|jgi:hypothetical protein|nr:hypothetical protein [Gammaproteobacteria bacterium]